MQAEFEEALYAEPVRGASDGPRRRSLLPLLVVAVAGLLVWNYLQLGYGPSWAHRTTTEPGADWHTVTEVPGLRVELPGQPIVDGADTASGFLQRARVGVDDQWDMVVDETVRAPADLRDALDGQYATLVAASTERVDDPGTDLPILAAGLVSGIEVTDVSIVESGTEPAGTRYDLVAGYRGFPRSGDSGTIRARIVVGDATTTIVASLSDQADSASLHDRLVAGFTPGGGR